MGAINVEAATEQAEFIINLTKSCGKKLGIRAGRHLHIESIDPHGLVADWNREHPDLEVKVGDKVGRANGVTGNPQKIAGQFSAEAVEMTLERQIQVAEDSSSATDQAVEIQVA